MLEANKQLDAENFSLREAVGGVRGVVESILPLLLFLILYTFVGGLKWPLIGALVSAVVFAAARLVQGQTLRQSLVGFLGVVICAISALFTGQAKDFFLPGFLINIAYLAVILLTLVVRRPLIGLGIALLRGLPKGWRRDYPQFYRRSSWATWMWVGLFVLRLGFQLPLYLMGMTTWLGTLRLTMGVPLFALVVWGNWVVLRGVMPEVKKTVEAAEEE